MCKSFFTKKSAKTILSKICELFFRTVFVQMKIADKLFIVQTWKGYQKKIQVICLLPVSKIFKIHQHLTVLSSKSYRCVFFGTPCIFKNKHPNIFFPNKHLSIFFIKKHLSLTLGPGNPTMFSINVNHRAVNQQCIED